MEVTNKEAIAVFEDMKRGIFPYDARPYCDAAIHALYVLYGKFDWIPVTDRLPDERDYVLCCDKDGYMTIGFISKWRTKEWCFDDDEIDIDVVAWMPLPKPYKEVEKMIQMTTDEKIKALQREGIEQVLYRMEHDLRNLALQAFDIGYKEGYKTGKECKEDPEEKDKDCRFCKFSAVADDEEPCISCCDHSSFKIREPGPKVTQDTINLKMRDVNGKLYEMEIPIKEKTCSHDECIHPYADFEQCTECHNESEPLTFDNVKVGDELRSIPSKPMYESTVIVVTYNCSERIYGFRKNTGTYMKLGKSDLSGWRKTGKTYPEIAKLIGGKSVQED